MYVCVCKQQLHGWICLASIACVLWVGDNVAIVGYLSIFMAASTGKGSGDTIHSYNAILRGDSSLIVTLQMCTIYSTDMAMLSCSVLSSHISSQKSLDKARQCI